MVLTIQLQFTEIKEAKYENSNKSMELTKLVSEKFHHGYATIILSSIRKSKVLHQCTNTAGWVSLLLQ